MVGRALGALFVGFLAVGLFGGGCGSNSDGAGCVGVACGPPKCGQTCGYTCGCCDSCPTGDQLLENGALYVCQNGCYELVASDAGSDAPNDASSDAANDALSDGIDCSNVGCSPPPLCSEGCTAVCGCCACGQGDTISTEAGTLVCNGGCYELQTEAGSDAAAD
jgi:hypothetical protein